jgi:hypothetical protein
LIQLPLRLTELSPLLEQVISDYRSRSEAIVPGGRGRIIQLSSHYLNPIDQQEDTTSSSSTTTTTDAAAAASPPLTLTTLDAAYSTLVCDVNAENQRKVICIVREVAARYDYECHDTIRLQRQQQRGEQSLGQKE